MSKYTCICFTRDCGSDNVTNTQNFSTLLFCFAKSCKSICSFTTLGNNQQYITFSNKRISVTEFRCILNLNRCLGQVFEQVLPYQTGVPAGSACCYYNSFCVYKVIHHVDQPTKLNSSLIRVDTPSHTVSNRPWLLKNFFKHKVGISRLFNFLKTHCQLVNLFCEMHIVYCFYFVIVFCHDGHLTVIKEYNLVRVLHYWRSIGSDKHFSISYSEEKRRPFSGYVELIGFIHISDSETICTYNLF